MRLNKFISHNSKYSRREADKLIEEGRVNINKKIITDFSYQVEKNDKVYVNGKPLFIKNRWSVIVYHKPKGELVTKKDERERKTIYHSLPKRFFNYIPIGRLDFASSGLILLTDSPEVATILMRSSLERVYYLKVKGSVGLQVEEAMQKGIFLEDATKGAFRDSKIKSMEIKPFLSYRIIKNEPTFSKLKVAIAEGKNRELRRFFGYFGNEVVSLKRVSFGGVSLDMLKEGKYRFLSSAEYNNLRDFIKERRKDEV